MKKKIFSILLSLAMIITMMPAQTLVVSAATKTKATVSTQTGLNKALKNKKLKTLTVKTAKVKTFSINKGTYKKVHMIIDASKSTVKNKSIFKKITIKKSKTLVMDASKGSIAVSKGGKVKEIRLTKSNSKINFNVSGELKKISIEKKSEINIKGSTKKSIAVNAGENSDETVIKTSVKLNAKIGSNAEVKLSDGSEGSSIAVTNKDVLVTVVNKTDVAYTAIDAHGRSVEIKKDATVVIGGKTPTPIPTPTPTRYTVIFNMNGHGTQISPVTNVVSGSRIIAPQVPSAEGHTFGGWYREAECTNEWYFDSDRVTANTTLYAKWTLNVEGVLSTTNFPNEVNSGWTTSSNGYYMYHCTDQASLMVYDTSSAEAVSSVSIDIALSAEGDNYSYTDTDGVKWTFNMNNGTLESVTISGATGEKAALNGTYTEPAACLATGTMITMANGSRQAVETLELGDMIKTFDHKTGEISTAPICVIWAIENCQCNFNLHFTDNITVSVVQEHCFFDRDTNRYEVITYQNASEYVGHYFYNADEDKWEKLLSIDFSEEPVTAYYIFTAKHYNHFAEGMLSLDPLDDGLMTYVFDFGENLKFDEDKMLADIEKYGLMTLEEMPYVPENYFEALNMQYLKIAYGKGLADKETVEEMIRYYIAQYN